MTEVVVDLCRLCLGISEERDVGRRSKNTLGGHVKQRCRLYAQAKRKHAERGVWMRRENAQ